MYQSIHDAAKVIDAYISRLTANKDKPLRVALSGHPSDDMAQRYFYASETDTRSDYADHTVGYVLPNDSWDTLYAMLANMANIADGLAKDDLARLDA